MRFIFAVFFLLWGLSACAPSGQEARHSDVSAEMEAFPQEVLLEKNACYTARLEYPFFARPAADQGMSAWAGRFFQNTLTELKRECRGRKSQEPPMEFMARYQVFSTRQIFSVRFDTWLDSGGAHGMDGVRTVTLRLRNGEELGYKDLFARPAGLWEFLSEYAHKALRPALDQYWRNMPEFEEGLAPEEGSFRHFVVTSEGVSLFFPTYQIAPYAAGPQRCDIPLEVLVRFVPKPGIWD